MTHSFDVFDTCLIRKCGQPQYVFDLMAERAFVKSVSKEEKQAFVAARIEAANISWSEKQTLFDIYAAFEYDNEYLLPKADLINLEIQIESEILEPISEILYLVRDLRSRGHLIMFISDMYLPCSFIREILSRFGFYEEGDKLYVSCEYGVTKASGKLFELIRDKESISYKKWHHHGDHIVSDIKVPKQKGIKTHYIKHTYTPYQKYLQDIPSLSFQWSGILSGINRSFTLQDKTDSHKCFFIDIIAPLFVSFVYRVMQDACDKKISNLYFCARDAYPLYRVALHFKSIFPEINCEYLYISRKSLYEGNDYIKLGYFKQIGLAAKDRKNAIVDIRSTGKTLQYLNSLLQDNGYDHVYGYFFELCKHSVNSNKDLHYHVEIDDNYIHSLSRKLKNISNNWYMYELFFPLNSQKRTLAYELRDKQYIPILEDKDVKEYILDNKEKYIDWRNITLDEYTRKYIELGLHTHSDKVFEVYALPILSTFLLAPEKKYLKALSNFYSMTDSGKYIPYVDNSYFRLPLNIFCHKTMWKRGTVFYTLPTKLAKFLYRINP